MSRYTVSKADLFLFSLDSKRIKGREGPAGQQFTENICAGAGEF